MPTITEDTVKKFWAVAAIVAVLVFGLAAWATKVNADIDHLRQTAEKQEATMSDVAVEVRLLREALIRAGTAMPDPKTGR